MEGKNPEIGEKSIVQLLDSIDNGFKLPERNKETEPFFSVEKVYKIKGKLIPFLLIIYIQIQQYQFSRSRHCGDWEVGEWDLQKERQSERYRDGQEHELNHSRCV